MNLALASLADLMCSHSDHWPSPPATLAFLSRNYTGSFLLRTFVFAWNLHTLDPWVASLVFQFSSSYRSLHSIAKPPTLLLNLLICFIGCLSQLKQKLQETERDLIYLICGSFPSPEWCLALRRTQSVFAEWMIQSMTFSRKNRCSVELNTRKKSGRMKAE